MLRFFRHRIDIYTKSGGNRAFFPSSLLCGDVFWEKQRLDILRKECLAESARAFFAQVPEQTGEALLCATVSVKNSLF